MSTPGGLDVWTWQNAGHSQVHLGASSSDHGQGTYTHITVILLSTAIGLRKYRIPSDLRSQAEYRLVSTTVGDHVGILGAVVFVIASQGVDPAWVGGPQLPGDLSSQIGGLLVIVNQVGLGPFGSSVSSSGEECMQHEL